MFKRSVMKVWKYIVSTETEPILLTAYTRGTYVVFIFPNATQILQE